MSSRADKRRCHHAALGAALGLWALLGVAPLGAETLSHDLDDIRQWSPIGGDSRIADDANKVTERVMGDPDFVKVSELPVSDPNRVLGRKVGQFLDRERKGFCSGSLVGPNLFLTNQHCVVDTAGGVVSMDGIVIAMEHEQAGQIGPDESLSGVARVLAHSQQLDYALLELDRPLGERYGWLEIETDQRVIDRERAVKVIQHPQARPKEIVTRNTEIVSATAPWLRYLADTEGGSSGSPVFGLEGDKIIALHHAGVPGKYNEGALAPLIAREIEQYLPVSGGEPGAAAPAATPAAAPAKPTEPPAEPGDWVPVTGGR